jgi:endonuclease/exonuclease/phosphatase (EEP) superfamily protein YafD
MTRLRHILRGRTLLRGWLSLVGVGAMLCAVVLYAMPPREVSSMRPLRVMTYNIEGRLVNQEHLLTLLIRHQPDLVMLQEVRHRRQLQQLVAGLHLPYWHFEPYHGHQIGIALLSRWPLGPAKMLTFRAGHQGKVALAAPVYGPERTLWACSVHLEAPRRYEFSAGVLQQGRFVWHELFATTPRSQQAQELRVWLTQIAAEPWIIGGDFNTVPFSKVDRYLSRHFNDVLLWYPWRYFTGTFWKLPQVPITPRIDFLYLSPDLRVREAQVIRRKVSDHFPILAVLSSLVSAY